MPLRIIHRFLFAALLLLPGLDCRASDYESRTWTNSVGIKMEATFVRVDGNEVTLLLKNDKIVTMTLDKFSPADQEYVHGLQSRVTPTPPPAAASPDGQAGAPAETGEPQTATAPPPTGGKSLLLRKPLIHEPDPRVQPKAEIYVPFPELGKSRSEGPVGMRIRIPANYSPDRPVPLLVWLAGGDGNNRFNEGMSFVDAEDFVLVGLNYPMGAPEPRFAQTREQMELLWSYEEKMLVKLQDMIPNIDKRLRVIVGFSNGAHIIGGCLARQIPGLCGYFNVFVLVEGGDSDKFDYPALPGRYYYVSWGDAKGGRGNEFGQMLANYARKAQMTVEAHPMPGIGHDLPDFEKAKIRAWLSNVVIPAQMGKP